MFENFPYTNFHDLNLDWIIDTLNQLQNSAVLSVNGQTGNVILYTEPNITLPPVDANRWQIVRTTNGNSLGVAFYNGLMYVVDGENTDRVYTLNHPPAYPVTSVDGQTGAVQVFPNAGTRLPDVAEDYTNIRRQITTNGTDNIVGIEVKQNKAYRMKDTNRYEIYDSNNPPPYPVTSVDGQTGAVTINYPVTSVNGQTGAVVLVIPFEDVSLADIIFADGSPDHYWGLGRETLDGTASIQLRTTSTKAEAYIDFFDDNGQVSYTKKLLTVDDIPSSSGVVSVNGQNGVVEIYGNTMPIVQNSLINVKQYIDQNLAFVENTNTATHNIPESAFVIWNNGLYRASTAISISDALSNSNLTAVSNGGLNDINDKFIYTAFTPVADPLAGYKFTSTSGCRSNAYFVELHGYIELAGGGKITTPIVTSTTVGTMPAGHTPSRNEFVFAPIRESGSGAYNGIALMQFTSGGNINVMYMNQPGFIWLTGISFLKN